MVSVYRLSSKAFPTVELAFESLARERSGIELLNVRQRKQSKTLATVFVPDGKLEHFERLDPRLFHLEEARDNRAGRIPG